MRSSSSGSVHAHPGVWVLECKELGVVSQTSRLDRAEDEVVEAIAYPSGLAPSEFDVEVVPVLPDEIETLHVHAEQTNKKAVAATREAADAKRALARSMRDQGFTVREMGQVLGVSYQRAAALAAG
ncbi:hypothetical protein M3A74_06825 [Corynebacterium appendicis]|uniref:hypothetical protein n=1 Tax=Corynebacterium appendicis TaxID=163202 RepID=UPI00223BA603|nr:hypothetical protein [Corynebacterium appendicis]MCT1684523.1 hypothetical protein [Corynebacterium appendicis]